MGCSPQTKSGPDPAGRALALQCRVRYALPGTSLFPEDQCRWTCFVVPEGGFIVPLLQKKENAPAIGDSPPTLREFFAPNVFTPKAIAALAALLAVRTILGLPFLTIYIGPGFKLITFAYVTDALTAMFFGPIAGAAFGFAGDMLGFLASTGAGGAYFPGFAISEIVTCFLFACFFYRRKIAVPRVIAAWLLNLAIVLLGMNSIWLIIMYGWSAGEAFALMRVVNNAVQSPIHIFILYMLLARLRRLDRYLH